MTTYLEAQKLVPVYLEVLDVGPYEAEGVSGTKVRYRVLDRAGAPTVEPLLIGQALHELVLLRDVIVEGGGGGDFAFTLLSHGAVKEDASTRNTTVFDADEGDLLVLYVMSVGPASTPENEANITWTQLFSHDPGGIPQRVFYGKVGPGGFSGSITINNDGEGWAGIFHQLVKVTGADTGGTNGENAIPQYKTVFDNSMAPVVSCVFNAPFGSPQNGALAFWIPREDDTGTQDMTARAGWTELAQDVSALFPGTGFLYMVGQSRLSEDTEASITSAWVDAPNYVLGCALEIKKAG